MLGGERRWDHQRTDLPLSRPLRDDVEHPADHGDHHRHVVGIREVVHADLRMRERVRAGEDDFAFAVRLHRIGENDHAFGVGGQPDVRVVEVLVGVDPKTAPPDVVVVAAREESDLRVVGVRVTQSGRVPRARVVQRRRHEAASGGRPFGDASFGLLLERLQLRGQVRVVGRIRRQRARGRAERVRTHGDADLGHRDTGAGCREHEGELQMVLQVLADVRRVEPARNADAFELVLRSDSGEQEYLW